MAHIFFFIVLLVGIFAMYPCVWVPSGSEDATIVSNNSMGLYSTTCACRAQVSCAKDSGATTLWPLRTLIA